MALSGASRALRVYTADDAAYMHIKQDDTDLTKMIVSMKNQSDNLANTTIKPYFTNVSAGEIGIGTTTPESSLHIVGSRNASTPGYGVHIGHSDSATGSFGLELVSNLSGTSSIDFTEPGQDVRGRILYDNASEELRFSANNALQVTISNNEVDCSDCLITTSGNIRTTGTGTMTSAGALTVSSGGAAITGDITNVTNITASGNIGIGTTSPESALHIMGTRNSLTPGYGVHIGNNGATMGNYGIEIVSNISGDSLIDFTEPNQNHRGRILYNNTSESFSISANTIVQMTISNNEIDCSDCLITTSGNISGNLNSTRGQLITFMGEEEGQLSLDGYDFSYGSAAGSSGIFGMLIPVSVKLKKFVYGNLAGVGPTNTDSVTIQLVLNNSPQAVYCLIDFSNTTNGSVSNRRFCEKFSSSLVSQVDIEPVISNPGYGISLSWRTISYSFGTDITRHRLSIIAETREDL